MNSSIKIVFADPHKFVLMEVQTLLQSSGQKMEVASFAQNQKALLHLAETHNTQIIVVKIQLPVPNGSSVVLKKFSENFPNILTIAYTLTG